ncbi:hypothetical protein SDJN03_11093, partial [Cucurbita argyrosperma subsp. sororia]
MAHTSPLQNPLQLGAPHVQPGVTIQSGKKRRVNTMDGGSSLTRKAHTWKCPYWQGRGLKESGRHGNSGLRESATAAGSKAVKDVDWVLRFRIGTYIEDLTVAFYALLASASLPLFPINKGKISSEVTGERIRSKFE